MSPTSFKVKFKLIERSKSQSAIENFNIEEGSKGLIHPSTQ